MLGGAAVHFSLAASFFTEVRPVGPVGDDFGAAEFEVLERRGVLTDDIERVAGRRVLLLARPLRVRPQRRPHRGHPARRLRRVRAEALARPPRPPTSLFLANIQPDLQRQVRAQCGEARFSALDSMNLWIETAKDSLLAAIAEVDCVIVNDAEIRQLTGESNLARAARAVMERGPARRRRQAGRVRRGAVHRGRLLRPARLPARGRARPDRRRRQLRRRLPRLPRQPRRRARRGRACGGRWATAPSSPPSTSRSSAPSGSRRLEPRGDRRALRRRCAAMTQFEPLPASR